MELADLRRFYWPLRFATWPPARGRARPGYTVLVPVPGDIPVLTELSLAAIERQQAQHRIATIVVPDLPSEAVEGIVSRRAASWPGELSLLQLRRPEQVLLPRLRDPGKNHASQLVRGIAASRSSHVVFHDADLFPLVSDLHERLWSTCADGRHAVCGVDPAWDPFFGEHARTLVATWEACADVDWLRSFPPFRLFAHETELAGEPHVVDTSFYAQWHTHPSRLRLLDAQADFAHFNYVISTFRHFQGSTGRFHDEHFRLLLLRALVDLYGDGRGGEDIPSRDELVAGLSAPDGPVVYRGGDAARYRQMADRLHAIVAASGEQRVSELETYLSPFEDWSRADPAQGLP